MKRTNLLLLLLSLAVFWAGCRSEKEKESKNPPNIIFILADDLGYNELGCYGQEIIQTPHIDRLAAEGMRFTQHYAGSPVCAPSRSVLMTGLHTGHTYIRDNREIKPEGQAPIPDSALTIAEVLKENGYVTAAIGKWGLGFPGSEGDPNKQGFDLFFGYNCQRHAHNHYPRYLWRNDEKVMLEGNDRTLYGEQYSQDLFTREALNFITANRDTNFFLYLPFIIPHVSIQVPEESLEKYKDSIPETPYEHHPYYLEHPYPHAGYAAMVTHMDEAVGWIMHRLEQEGIDGNTLVIFASDNGPTYARVGGADSEFFNSAGPFRGFKGSVYEGGIRVPFIARWPGEITPDTITDHISYFPDLFPTFADVAGIEDKYDVDGISLLPVLLGENASEHKYLYWEFPAYGGQQAIRYGNWKGVRKNLFKDPDAAIELYDLENDIDESNDLASENPEIVLLLDSLMKAAHIPSETFPFEALDNN
ncbi:MAG: arylsulfatase [Bacteroidales bacterium]|jgi:arylsulfatase|nr:arylsulfatase [Bacteroidales bacterium]